VGFVGLVAPHLARLQTKSNRHGPLLFPVVLWGILLCALADLLAHHLFGKFTLNVNAVCAILGAPIVLWTLWKSRLSD
jgi:iron complex transport system permease protein